MTRTLITGATKGIGRALAHALAADGHTITAVARTEQALKSLMEELDGPHDYLTADLATPSGLRDITAALKARPYDLLVNNAGLGHSGSFASSDLDQVQAAIRLNCEAVVTLAHAFLAAARPGAALVNVSSTLAFTPKPDQAVYSATKAFVTSFSEALWYEQKAHGVYVLGLCPGPTTTRPGLHADTPSALVQSPEAVAATALTALRERRHPTVASGRANTLFTTVARLIPRRTGLRLLAEG
ncbi:SDR family NAD(P)-dependent oxidoreductase [Streptomyces sp.]|uniref:SDR family NAD(P)-dependent oxidoreductase n=1 Tax=Streptomyces sp. TaxID=1931 RepID=UPI002F9209C8